jgi:hypothetical protein
MPIELTTKVYRPLPTVASTLDAQQRSVYIQNLLTTNGGCTLPCLLGIIPGKSSWEEVQRFFATLGEPAPHQNFHSKYGIISYYYRFDPPKENPKSLGWAIEFYISENEINLLSFNIASPARNPVFTSQYSVKAITEAMGEPTAIGVYIYVYSFPGTASYYTFDVTYHVADMWLVFKYRGFVERPDDETLIFCPTHPYLDHTGSGLDDTVSFFIQPGKDLYTDLELLNLGLPPSEGFPFKMVTGEDVHYFYEKMMAAKPGEKVCFTSKVSVFGIHGGAK